MGARTYLQPGLIGTCHPVDVAQLQQRVDRCRALVSLPALSLRLAQNNDPFAHHDRAFSGGRETQRCDIHARRLHLQVDPMEQRPGKPCAISANALNAASATHTPLRARTAGGGTPAIFASHSVDATGIDGSNAGGGSTALPNVFHNGTGSPQIPYGSIAIQPNELAFHPGPTGDQSVVSLTAPAAGIPRAGIA